MARAGANRVGLEHQIRPGLPPPPPTYQTRPVAPQSQAPVPTSGPNATVGDAGLSSDPATRAGTLAARNRDPNAAPYPSADVSVTLPSGRRVTEPEIQRMATRPVEGAANDPENAAPYQTAGKDWEPVPTKPPANAPAPAPAPTATGAPAPAAPPPGPSQGGPQPYRPPPNIRGAAGVPPPDTDMSPAAQANRAFPSAAQQSHRDAYQIQLERQAKEDQLKRETLQTRDTPADRMARDILKANVRRLNNMDTNAQRQYSTDMHKIIADDKLFEHAREQVVRQMGDAVGELMKNYRNGVAMMGSKYVPSEDEKGAMIAAHDMMMRGTGAPQVSQPPAAPGGATVSSPAVRTVPPAVTQQPNTGMPNLGTYTGATPPWAAPQGQKWQQHPTSKLWRLAPQ